MKILPIGNYETNFRGSGIPNSVKLDNVSKREYIEALKLAKIFDDFGKNLRNTMETFVYMVKNKG